MTVVNNFIYNPVSSAVDNHLPSIFSKTAWMSSVELNELENVGARPWDQDATDRRVVQGVKDGSRRVIQTEKESAGIPRRRSHVGGSTPTRGTGARCCRAPELLP